MPPGIIAGHWELAHMCTPRVKPSAKWFETAARMPRFANTPIAEPPEPDPEDGRDLGEAEQFWLEHSQRRRA